jgi:hypothetical protein
MLISVERRAGIQGIQLPAPMMDTDRQWVARVESKQGDEQNYDCKSRDVS